jgi:hypothetical protein
MSSSDQTRHIPAGGSTTLPPLMPSTQEIREIHHETSAFGANVHSCLELSGVPLGGLWGIAKE